MNSKISTRVLCWTFLLALLVPAFALLPMVNAQSSAAAREIQWVIAVDQTCLNPTFCVASATNPGMSTFHVSATPYSDHTVTAFITATVFDKSGHIVYRYMETDKAVWKTGPGTGGPNDFILVSGTNTTMVFANGHQTTTVQKIHNYDTGVAAKQQVLDCDELYGVACPSDVSGIESVTLVS